MRPRHTVLLRCRGLSARFTEELSRSIGNLIDLANAVWCFADVGEGGGPVAEQARRLRLMCDAYRWRDTDAIVDEIQADLLRALANHERAGRTKAANIFREMVRWIDVHSGALKRLARG